MESTVSRFKYLLTSLESMARKPVLDSSLGELLDKFLDKLAENDKYLTNGIFNTNFGEAALLLQSSVDVYVKKVDILWEKIIEYQKHIITYQKDQDDDEVERLEERRNRYKRKRKRDNEEQKTLRQSNEDKRKYSHNDVNILSQTYDIDEDIMHTWKKLNEEETIEDSYSKLTCSDATLFQPKDEINPQDDDLALKYSQIRTTTVVEEIFNLEDNRMLEDAFQGITRMRIASYVVNNYKKELTARRHQKESFSEDLQTYILNFIEKRKKADGMENSTAVGLIRKDSMPSLPSNTCDSASVVTSSPQDDPPVLEPQVDLPLTPNKKATKIGEANAEEAPQLQSQLSSPETPKKIHQDCFVKLSNDNNISEKIRKLSVTDKQVGFQEDENNESDSTLMENCCIICHDTDSDDSGGIVDNSRVDNQEHKKTCRKKIDDNVKNFTESSNLEPVKLSSRQRILKIRAVCTQPCCKNINEKVIKSPIDEKSEDSKTNEITEESQQKRLSKRERKKLATGVSVLFSQFEKFYAQNYQRDNLEEGLEVTIITGADESDNDTESICCSNIDHEDSGIEQFEFLTIISGSNSDNINDSGVGLSEVTFKDSLETAEGDNEISDLTPCEAEDSSLGILNDNLTPVEGMSSHVHEEADSIPHQGESSPNEDLVLEGTEAELLLNENESSQTQELVVEEANASLVEDEDSQHSEGSTNSAESQSQITEQEKIDKSVHDWKSFITPRLQRIGNRSDFDIHDYGYRMIDPFELNETRHFSNIVENKPSSEVARYFIAMLQLANTHNIEIKGAQPGKLSNDTLAIEVLSKERYHDKLEMYQAPSERTFKQRLARAQEMNPKVILYSTPLVPSPSKRFKPSTVRRNIIFS